MIFWHTTKKGIYVGNISCPTIVLKNYLALSVYVNIYDQSIVNAGYLIGFLLINCLSYADGLVLIVCLSLGLSMILSVCLNFGREHDIKNNSTKSNVITYCYKSFKDIDVRRFVLQGCALPTVSKCKYLGYIITENLITCEGMSR